MSQLPEIEQQLPDHGRVLIETSYDSTPPSIAIVGAIADIEDVDPSEVDFVLYDDIDPDALDALFDVSRQVDSGEDPTITMDVSIGSYNVVVHNNGNISIVNAESA